VYPALLITKATGTLVSTPIVPCNWSLCHGFVIHVCNYAWPGGYYRPTRQFQWQRHPHDMERQSTQGPAGWVQDRTPHPNQYRTRQAPPQGKCANDITISDSVTSPNPASEPSWIFNKSRFKYRKLATRHVENEKSVIPAGFIPQDEALLAGHSAWANVQVGARGVGSHLHFRR
jgi:hypothetical protein